MKGLWNEAEERINWWLSETCYQWVSGVTHVPTIFISELSSIWEWKYATTKSILALKFSDSIWNAPTAMLILLSRLILKIMTT